MSVITANGATVLEAELSFPRVGVWHATVDIDADSADAFVGRIEINAGEAGVLVGTAPPNRVSLFAGRVRAKVVGGGAGFGAEVAPKFYRSIVARTVLRETLEIGNERLADSSHDLDALLPFWTRPESSVGEAFEEAVTSLGLIWRVLDDGTVWVGRETWPAAQLSVDAKVLDENSSERTATIADGERLRPGMMFDGRHVGRVEIVVTPSESRTTAWFQERDAEGDPIRVALTKIVRQMTRTIDFLAAYPARVAKQNADGSLELVLKSEKMPHMSRIPIRYGVPGVRAKVKPGSFVHVEFEHGDPSGPVATVWDRESVAELTVKADRVVIDAGDVEVQKGRPLARVGDIVQVISTPPGTPAIGQIMTGNNLHRG